jgi:flagellin
MTLRIAADPNAGLLHRLEATGAGIGRSMKRLAAGLRIPSASEDAAGLSMAERLKARIRSLDQARRNATDGISLVQTAEGALGEVAAMLIRMRELAVQARNGTTSSSDRSTLNREFLALAAEVARIGDATEFNGIRLLNGSRPSVNLQIGTDTKVGVDTLTVRLSPLANTLALRRQRIDTPGTAASAMRRLDTAIERLGTMRGSLGAAQQRLEHTIGNLSSASEQASAAESRIRDVDIAAETAKLTRQIILQQATFAILAQANANQRVALFLLTR